MKTNTLILCGLDHSALPMAAKDFVALGKEWQPVLEWLRTDGGDIVAIHSHMATEKPQELFLHYRNRGTAADLAKLMMNAPD